MFTDKSKDNFRKKYKEHASGCWQWTSYVNKSHGYGEFVAGGRKHYAHRASYQIHKGPIPADMCVCHTCDNRECVNPDHLWLGSISDNIKDMWSKGRAKYTPMRGTNQKDAKLTEECVRQIRAATGSQRMLAEKFGVSQTVIHNVRSGKTWKHVT